VDRYTEGVREAAFEFGIKRLAHELDMSEQRLYKKLDPDGSVRLTVEDFFRITRIVQDMRCIQPVLDDLGATALPSEQRREGATLCELILEQQQSVGQVAQTIREALEDHRIEAHEQVQIDRSIHAAIQALSTLRRELEGMVEPRLAKA